jgi:hypothetical protein
MILWTIQTAILCFILIFLVHHLLNFFTETLTVPKVKDLIYAPAQKYEKIYQTIQQSTSSNSIRSNNTDNNTSNINTTSLADLLPTAMDTETMKNELKSFLKNQQKPKEFGSSDSFSQQYSTI